MKVHSYKTSSGRDLIVDYINKLSKDEKIDALSVLDKIANDKIDELTIKLWQSKVWEVYFYKHNRIFYVIIENTDIYLLHACRKQKNKTEKKDTEIVTKRAKELGSLLKKKLI